MGQLSPDRFAPGAHVLAVEEAIAGILAEIAPVADSQEIALADADGRILAEDLVATLPLPPFSNAAVDGYAVAFADLAASGATTLPVAARVPAGESAPAPARGQAVRIFTGAPMPDGCDTVVMQEDVQAQDGRVTLPPGLAAGANRRLAGEDLPAGTVALACGHRMTPEAIALAAAIGASRIKVRRRPRIAVFSTGNELVPPGAPRGPAQINDVNRVLLQALLRRLGACVTDLGILADDRAGIARSLRAAAENHDAILTSGGVSTGEEDHVKAAVEEIGRLAFWRLPIKPGRPVAMGRIGADTQAGTLFIGLPGNPVAAFVTFVLLVRPVVVALGGGDPAAPLPLPVRAGFAHVKRPGRREYLRAALRPAADGGVEAVKHPQEGTGVLTSLTATDGLVMLPEALERVAPGDMVDFLPYSALR